MAGPLSVAFSNGPGGGWVGLFPVGTSGPNGYVDWQWVTGTQTFSAQVNTVTSGTVTFPRAGMGPVPVGTYVYRWVKDGMVIAQSATLTVAGPTLALGQTTGATTGPLSVAFSDGPGGGWVGLFPVGTSGPNGYVDWQWVTGGQTFTAAVNTVTSGTVTFPRAGMGPVPAGPWRQSDGWGCERRARCSAALF